MKTSQLHYKQQTEIKPPRPETVVIFDKMNKRFCKVNKMDIITYNGKVDMEKRYEYLPEFVFDHMKNEERMAWYGLE